MTRSTQTVTTSCGCTSAYLDRSELSPGVSTLLHIAADLSRKSGLINISATVRFDSGEPETFVLRVDVIRRVACAPEFISFGAIDVRALPSREFRVMTASRVPQPPEPRIVAANKSDRVRIEIVNSDICRDPKGHFVRTTRAAIHLVAGASTAYGPQQERLIISAGGGEAEHVLEVPVTWARCSDYEVSPAKILLGRVEADAVSRSIPMRVSRIDGAAFAIRKLSSTCDAFTCNDATLGAQERAANHEIEVLFSPDNVQRFAFGKLLVSIDDPHEPELTIPVAAYRVVTGPAVEQLVTPEN